MAMNKPNPKTDYSKQPYAKKKGKGSRHHRMNRGMHYGKTY